MNSELSKSQLKQLEQSLRDRHSALTVEIHEVLLETDDEHFKAVAGLVHDDAEASVVDLVAGLHLHRINHLVEEIRAVENALVKLHQGSYGICIDCGNIIPFKRLEARPTAVRCILCQQKNEREYWSSRGATL
jgi:RNA polymerase-binding protein DksA